MKFAFFLGGMAGLSGYLFYRLAGLDIAPASPPFWLFLIGVSFGALVGFVGGRS